MKFLVIGAGSSAKRFIKILQTKGHKVFVYQHRTKLSLPPKITVVTSLEDIICDGVIISSPTSTHLAYAQHFVSQGIPTLIEKPISDTMKGVLPLLKLAQKKNTIVMTGFNLRFLPITKIIKKYCDQHKLGEILHANLYVGQYLPDWRPWLDYRDNYSASYKKGGGVSLDLIHEIDLALHFFPEIKLTSTVSKKLGDLDIDTEDFVCFQTHRKPLVFVSMDYLNHVKLRQYRIVGTKGSIFCDIFGQYFIYRSMTGKQKIISDHKFFDIPASFAAEIDHFIALIKRESESVTLRSLGIDALKIALKGRCHVQR